MLLHGGLTPKAYGLVGMPLLLVLENLTVEFIHHEVNRCVKIRILALSKQFFSLDVQIHLNFLLKLIHRHKHIGVNHLVKVPVNPLKFGGEIAA